MHTDVPRRSARRTTLALAVASALAASSIALSPTTAYAGDVTRIGGDDRVATAIQIFEQNPTVFTSDTVIITRSDAYADALTATPLAAALKAPVLTTGPGGLDPRVLESLKKNPKIKNVIVIGGPGAVAPAVSDQLSQHFATSRISGATRYETAVKIAEKVMEIRGTDSVPVFLATGTNFPDALAAGAAAAAKGAVVLLSQGPVLSPETAAFIKSDKASQTTAVGGPAGAAMNSAGVVGPIIIGKDRYDTAAKLAAQVHPDPSKVVLASGETYADSLAGAALAAITGAPLVLTGSAGLPAATKAYIDASDPEIALLGGPKAIPANVATAVATTVGGVVRDGTTPTPTPAPTPTPTTPVPTPPAPTTPAPSPSDPPPVVVSPPGGGGDAPVIEDPRPQPTDPSTEQPSEIAWTSELAEKTLVAEGDQISVSAEANWYDGVQFQVWTKSPRASSFTASQPQTSSSWGIYQATEEHHEGTQLYFTAVWKGKTIKTGITTLEVVTESESPDAKVADLSFEEVADANADRQPHSTTAAATATGVTDQDGTLTFEVKFDGDGITYLPQASYEDGRFVSQLQAPIPGEYTVTPVFHPKNPYAHRFTRFPTMSFQAKEDPSSPLRDVGVTVGDVPDLVASKEATFSAQVTREGKPVDRGTVVFYLDRSWFCDDHDGSDGWSCARAAGSWDSARQLRAQYVEPYQVTPEFRAATRLSAPTSLTVRPFTLTLSDGVTRGAASDPIRGGLDTDPLTRGGRPLTITASDGIDLASVELQQPSRLDRNSSEVDVPPTVTVDGDDERISVSAPANVTPGVWAFWAEGRTAKGYPSEGFPLFVEVLPADGVVRMHALQPHIYLQGQDGGDPFVRLPAAPGVSWRVGDKDYGTHNMPGELWQRSVPMAEGDITVVATPAVDGVILSGPTAWSLHVGWEGISGYTSDPSRWPRFDDSSGGGQRLVLSRIQGVVWKVDGQTYGDDAYENGQDTVSVAVPQDGNVHALPAGDGPLSGPISWHLVSE